MFSVLSRPASHCDLSVYVDFSLGLRLDYVCVVYVMILIVLERVIEFIELKL